MRHGVILESDGDVRRFNAGNIPLELVQRMHAALLESHETHDGSDEEVEEEDSPGGGLPLHSGATEFSPLGSPALGRLGSLLGLGARKADFTLAERRSTDPGSLVVSPGLKQNGSGPHGNGVEKAGSISGSGASGSGSRSGSGSGDVEENGKPDGPHGGEEEDPLKPHALVEGKATKSSPVHADLSAPGKEQGTNGHGLHTAGKPPRPPPRAVPLVTEGAAAQEGGQRSRFSFRGSFRDSIATASLSVRRATTSLFAKVRALDPLTRLRPDRSERASPLSVIQSETNKPRYKSRKNSEMRLRHPFKRGLLPLGDSDVKARTLQELVQWCAFPLMAQHGQVPSSSPLWS